MSSTRTITAQPAGRDRFGCPLASRTFVIDRDPEDWGGNKSRIFRENRSLPAQPGDAWANGRAFHFTPEVVLTDTIRDVEPVSA